jgi:hypothetical protein
VVPFRWSPAPARKRLGRYPAVSLKEARELARKDRALLQQGTNVAADKQQEKLKAEQLQTIQRLSEAWYGRHILGKHKHPEIVERLIRRHIKRVIGKLLIKEVRPCRIDRVLTRIVDAGAPTVANDALRHLVRMFHFAVKRRWIETNPAYGFDMSDAGGTESSRVRWLRKEALIMLTYDMKATPNFGRADELAIWLLLALCVRKMELLSATLVGVRSRGRGLAPAAAPNEDPVGHRHSPRRTGHQVAQGVAHVRLRRRAPVSGSIADSPGERRRAQDSLPTHQPGHLEPCPPTVAARGR